MNFSLFFNFDGNCRAALDFYEKVFHVKAERIMTYAEIPDADIDERDKDRITYADMAIGDCMVMLMDFPSDPGETPLQRGNSIQPSLMLEDKTEIERIFHALCEGGQVLMPLGKTFWSEYYGSVQDQFGIYWNLSYFDSSQWAE